MSPRAAVFVASLLALAVGAGLVVGDLLSVVVGVGAGLIVAAAGGLAASFRLEWIPEDGP